MQEAGCPDECEQRNEWAAPCLIALPRKAIPKVLETWWQTFKGVDKSLEVGCPKCTLVGRSTLGWMQELEVDLNACYEKSLQSSSIDNLTFDNLLKLLKPVAYAMGLNKVEQYRIDFVLCVEHGIHALHLAGPRFTVRGEHSQADTVATADLPPGAIWPGDVEITLEAQDEAQAVEWVR